MYPVTHYVRVLQPGITHDFETVRYIFISFFILLNKHVGSVITRLRFDLQWKNQPAQFFYNRKDVMKSVSHSDTCVFEKKWKSHMRQPVKESNSPALSLLVAFKQNSCTLVGYRADSLCLRLTSFLVRLFPQLGRKRMLHRVAKKKKACARHYLLLFTGFICLCILFPLLEKDKVFFVCSRGRP